MEENLITLEVAKLAREKGFNQVKLGLSILNNPSQSILQKWIREVHNIHISVDIEMIVLNKPLFEVAIFIADETKEFGIIRRTKTSSYDSYEEALERGIEQALNLIK